jgi:hypothetical protein
MAGLDEFPSYVLMIPMQKRFSDLHLSRIGKAYLSGRLVGS